MDITIDNITPFMVPPIPEGQTTNVATWLTAVSARLTAAFGATLPTYIAPAVYDIVAVAVQRRLSPLQGADPRVAQQARADASIRYNTALSGLTGFFFPSELAELTSLFQGGGSVVSTRTPAPDGIRYGNVSREEGFTYPSELEDGDEGGEELTPVPDDDGYFEFQP